MVSELPSNRMEAIAVTQAFRSHAGIPVANHPIDLIADLSDASKDSDEILRRDALEALASFNDPRVIEALRSALDDESDAVRNLAAELLEARD